MLCPKCHGKRGENTYIGFVPCSYCSGSGEVSCCEGVEDYKVPPEINKDKKK